LRVVVGHEDNLVVVLDVPDLSLLEEAKVGRSDRAQASGLGLF
jgi:hypothetical protein